MANEFNESFNAPAECTQNICSLGEYALARPDTQPTQFDRQSNSNLENAGILPKMDLMMADGINDLPDPEIQDPFKKDVSTKQMKEAGVKASERVDADGTKTTTGEYPSGVTIKSTEGKTVTTSSGRTVELTGSDIVTVKPPLHESKKDSGVWVDGKGREVAKRNEDGSVTVDSGDGGFYKQDSHGIKKVSAIRSRDGKTFEEIDTDSPLGNLRPPQIPVRK